MQTYRPIAFALLVTLLAPAGCIVVQSVPDDRGRGFVAPVAPSARIVIEDRRPSAPAPAELPPK
jgi:hypothetical protein